MTTFDVENTDEMIVQLDIPFYSFCEHHLLPFFGKGYIAYVPEKKIVGLSKLARSLEMFSRRLQNLKLTKSCVKIELVQMVDTRTQLSLRKFSEVQPLVVLVGME